MQFNKHTHTHTHTYIRHQELCSCARPLNCVVLRTYTWHIAHIQKRTNGAARAAKVVDPEGGTHQNKTGLKHVNSMKTRRGTFTYRWNKAQKTQPVSTGRGEWGRRKHMSPSSEDTPGHTGQEVGVSLEFFSLTVLRFVVALRRPPDYATSKHQAR